MEKPTVLVIVSGGVAEIYANEPVTVGHVDMDNTMSGDTYMLPDTPEMRKLAKLAEEWNGIKKGEDYEWEDG